MTIENIPPNGPGQFAAWMKEIERQIANINTARNLENASFTGRLRSIDDAGADRVVIGRITDDPATYGISIAEGAITVGGGTVRALSASGGSDAFNNATLTSDISTVHTSVTLTKPSWATQAILTAEFLLQVSNNSGGGVLIGARLGPGAVTMQMSIPNGETRVLPTSDTRVLSGLSGNVTVQANATCSVTNTTNFGPLRASVIWLR